MKTRVLLFTVFLSVSFNLFSQVEWQSIASPVSENLKSVWVTEVGNFYIVSEEGSIISTKDGGTTWHLLNYPGYDLKSICFSDNEHGAICGNNPGGTVLTTTDAGESWQIIAFDETNLTEANCVFFKDNNNGFTVGTLGDLNQCLKTSNGGQFWEQPSFPLILESIFYGIHFRDSLSGNMVGSDGIFYTSNTGGDNWAMNISFPQKDLNAIYNFGEQTGVVVGNDGTAFYTINKWYQHIDLNTNVIVHLNGVWGDPETNKLWAVGDTGTIIYMDYYLLGWTEQNSGTSENLNGVFILNENYGVAVGENGTILEMKSPSSVAENKNPNEVSVFPNPCNEKVTIRISGSSKNIIELKVFDLLGNEVSQLYSGVKPSRNFDVNFNTSELPDGVYFVRLNTDDYSIVKKIIVNRK